MNEPIPCAFVEIPGFINDAGLPTEYLGFANCTSGELLRSIYIVGEYVKVVFEKPILDLEPEGWRAEIKEPLANIDYPGTVVLHIHRRFDDPRTIITSPRPSSNMPTSDVWLFPETTDLAAKRLVNCANLVNDSEDEDLHRYVQARDIRETRVHGLFDKITTEIATMIEALVTEYTPTQRSAWEHIRDTKYRVAFIMGPPGTGKPTWYVFSDYYFLVRRLLGVVEFSHHSKDILERQY